MKRKPITKLEFEARSASCKRVMIAEDVIAQINARKYFAEAGTYIRVESDDTKFDSPLIDIHEDSSATCHVCAVGSCVVSIASIEGTLTESDMNEETPKLTKILGKIFPVKQLALMECAFEGCGNYAFADRHGIKLSRMEEESCEYFYDEYEENDEVRLKRIMENIVRNKGKFVPKQL